MNTKLLEIFIEVVNTQSFAKAARVLDLDPSAVSRAIQQLEAELNCTLFQRTTRHLAITEAGTLTAQRAQPILDAVAQLKESSVDDIAHMQGRVCISTSVAFGQTCVMPFVNEFLSAYPKIHLDLKLTDQNLDLVTDKIDFAIRLSPAIENNVVRSKLLSTQYRLCASSSYLSSAPQLEAPEDLAHHRVVTFDLPAYKRAWKFKLRRGTREVKIKPTLTIASALAIQQALLNDLGVGILPHWLADDLIRCEKLVNLFPTTPVTATNFDTAAWLIYQNRQYLPRRTRVAIDFFAEKIKTNFRA
ncbi:LysR family transcriptional regulator [Arenicella chitinivorans]|uniref:LysR family transcriptional regulator n=1 Tax=Arenicella chitinivorans TaxID=1329800 RepID=A0A918VNC5_9GAMM|nr:LysR family transcriptional regulator [Arenicella chitinivorans]GHA10372.1 LysR family transcriptional regulator [Arenicella chitinivorans]